MSTPVRTDAQVEKIAESAPDEYHFYVWPAFVMVLPMIIIGYKLAFLGWIWPSVFSPEVCWQTYLVVIVYTLVALGYDFERLVAAIIFMVILAIVLILWLISISMGWNLFGNIVGFFASLDAQISVTALLQISVWLTLVYLLMMIDVRLNHRVNAKGETLSIPSFFGGTSTYKLTGTYAPRMEIPDLLEYFFLGIGALRVTDTENKVVLLRRVFRVRRKEMVLLLMASAVDVEREPDRV